MRGHRRTRGPPPTRRVRLLRTSPRRPSRDWLIVSQRPWLTVPRLSQLLVVSSWFALPSDADLAVPKAQSQHARRDVVDHLVDAITPPPFVIPIEDGGTPKRFARVGLRLSTHEVKGGSGVICPVAWGVGGSGCQWAIRRSNSSTTRCAAARSTIMRFRSAMRWSMRAPS